MPAQLSGCIAAMPALAIVPNATESIDAIWFGVHTPMAPAGTTDMHAAVSPPIVSVFSCCAHCTVMAAHAPAASWYACCWMMPLQAYAVSPPKQAAFRLENTFAGISLIHSTVNPLHWVNGATVAAAASKAPVHPMQASGWRLLKFRAVAPAMSLGARAPSSLLVKFGQSTSPRTDTTGDATRQRVAAARRASGVASRMVVVVSWWWARCRTEVTSGWRWI